MLVTSFPTAESVVMTALLDKFDDRDCAKTTLLFSDMRFLFFSFSHEIGRLEMELKREEGWITTIYNEAFFLSCRSAVTKLGADAYM